MYSIKRKKIFLKLKKLCKYIDFFLYILNLSLNNNIWVLYKYKNK